MWNKTNETFLQHHVVLFCRYIIHRIKETQSNRKGKAIPVQAWTGPDGSRGFEALGFQDSQHMMVVSLSALRPRGCRPQGQSNPGRNMSMRNPNNKIGNRTRDLPTFSAVPQPTAPPRTPRKKLQVLLLILFTTATCFGFRVSWSTILCAEIVKLQRQQTH